LNAKLGGISPQSFLRRIDSVPNGTFPCDGCRGCCAHVLDEEMG